MTPQEITELTRNIMAVLQEQGLSFGWTEKDIILAIIQLILAGSAIWYSIVTMQSLRENRTHFTRLNKQDIRGISGVLFGNLLYPSIPNSNPPTTNFSGKPWGVNIYNSGSIVVQNIGAYFYNPKEKNYSIFGVHIQFISPMNQNFIYFDINPKSKDETLIHIRENYGEQAYACISNIQNDKGFLAIFHNDIDNNLHITIHEVLVDQFNDWLYIGKTSRDCVQECSPKAFPSLQKSIAQ